MRSVYRLLDRLTGQPIGEGRAGDAFASFVSRVQIKAHNRTYRHAQAGHRVRACAWNLVCEYVLRER